MRSRGWLGALALMLTVSCATRKVPVVPGPPMPSGAPDATVGRTLVIRLAETVGTDEAREGERVDAVVAAPLVDDRGHVLVPDGARVEGRVRRLVEGKAAVTPRIELVFDRLELHGEWVPIHGEVAAADIDISAPGTYRSGDPAARAWAGADLGAIMFGFSGFWMGHTVASLGAIPHTVQKRNATARIEAGSFLTLHLLPVGRR